MWKLQWRKKTLKPKESAEKVILNQDGSLSLNFQNQEVIERLLASFAVSVDAELRELEEERRLSQNERNKRDETAIFSYSHSLTE